MKKLWLLLLIAVLLTGGALGEEEPLYPICENGLWGYMNRAGETVIPPQWMDAEPFFGNAAIVEVEPWKEDAWEWGGLNQGLIDRQGNTILDPRYYLEEWENIIIIVEYLWDEEGEYAGIRCGYYDKASGFLCMPQYDDLYDGGPGYVLTGRWETVELDGGEAPRLLGYLRADTGELAVPAPENAYGVYMESYFSEGLALVEILEEGGWRSAFLDETGALISLPEGVIPHAPVQGGAFPFVREDREGVGLMRPDGTVLAEAEYDAIVYLTEGLYAYRPGPDQRWGLMSAEGERLTQARFSRILPNQVSDGFIRAYGVGEDGQARWFILDRTGKTVFSEYAATTEDFAAPLPEGAPRAGGVFSLQKIVYGTDLVWYGYTWGDGLEDQWRNRRFGLMKMENGEARYWTPPEYEYYKTGFAGDDPSGLMAVEQDGLYGYLDAQGRLAIPCQWPFAEPFRDGLAQVWDEDGRMAYIDYQGAVVWQAAGEE